MFFINGVIGINYLNFKLEINTDLFWKLLYLLCIMQFCSPSGWQEGDTTVSYGKIFNKSFSEILVSSRSLQSLNEHFEFWWKLFLKSF